MGNVRMRAEQINYGATNVKKALDDLSPKDLIALSGRMDTIEAWKATVKAEEKTGSSVEFTNALALNAVSLSTEIEPIQDLHGLPFPYVGGAYKNKLDSSKRVTNPDWCVFGGTLSDNVPNGDVSVKSGQWTISISEVVSTLQVYDASGTRLAADSNANHLTFTSAADQNIKIAMNKIGGDWANYTYQLESGSTATSYAPYSNICPISGRAEVVVVDEGINIWDEQWEIGGIDATTGQNNNANNCIRGAGYIGVTPTQSIYLKFPTGSDKRMVVHWYDRNKNYIAPRSIYDNTKAVTVPSNAYYMRFYMTDEYGTTYGNNISVNYPSTFTDYVPYAHSSATIQLGQTVYGGTVDLVTGAVRITHAIEDMGNLTYSKLANNIFAVSISDKAIGRTNFLSSQYEVIDSAWGSLANGQITGAQSSGYIHVKDERYNDETDYKTAVTGAKICYELATPIELTLSPVAVEMLKGYNRLSSDGGGDITVKAYTGAAWGGDET